MARRRFIRSLAAGVAAVLSLTGCGGSDDESDVGKDMGNQDSQYYEAAKEEGEVVWYTAHMDAETAQKLADIFEEAYPGVKVTLYRQTAQRIYQRFVQEGEAGSVKADVFGATEMGIYEDLKEKGLLEQFTLDPSIERLDQYTEYDDPEGYYHIADVASNVIIYNNSQVKDDEAPKSWDDLLSEKWKDQIATGHPGGSGMVGTWVTWLYLNKGPEYIQQLSEQNVLVGQSANDPLPKVGSGERPIGVVADSGAAQQIQAGSPISVVYPSDGAILNPMPNAVAKDAPHPNAAKLFAEFMFDQKFQQYRSDEFGILPTVPDVSSPEELADADDATYDRASLEEYDSAFPDALKLWQDSFGA